MPVNSHFHFDMILSLVTAEYHKDQSWLSNNFHTYVKLKPGADAQTLQAKFPQMIDTYAGPQAKLALGGDFTMEKFRAAGNKIEFTLRPLTDIHLHSDLTAELGVNSDITYIYLFTAVAFFILAIACVNFMNLSTARSANRAKEVGVRKVMGSLRSHLVNQFLMESMLLSVVAFVLALGFAWLTLPVFNELAARALTIPFSQPGFWLIIVTSALVVGLLAGVYPAFFLSAFRPINVSKGQFSLGMKSGFVRSALVVFQFSLSILLIIATLAVNRQLNYIQNKKLGFNKEQVIVVKDAYGLGKHLTSFKDEMLKDSRISHASLSGYLPVAGTSRSDNTFWPEGLQPTQENLVSIQCWRVDVDYVKTFGMKIKEGRDFSLEFPSDSSAVLLNEAALALFGFNKDVIGKKITTFSDNVDGNFDPNHVKSYHVIGVIENFHFESLRQNITPLALFMGNSNELISFRFEAQNAKEVIATLENRWQQLASGLPFSYSFLDDDFEHMYSSEQKLSRLFLLFASLAIVIACLGLFALTAFTAEQRTKEIGIRKVLGASASSIVFLKWPSFRRPLFLIDVPHHLKRALKNATVVLFASFAACSLKLPIGLLGFAKP